MEEITNHLEQWKAFAQAQAPKHLSLSVEVTLREAVRVACSLKKRWEPKGKIPGLRGLPELSLSHADDILSLVRAVQEAQFLSYVEEESAPVEDEEPPLVKAKRLITSLRLPLEYLADTLSPDDAARVYKFKGLSEHKQNDEASVYLLLRLYVEVASSAQQQLSTLWESFELTLIDESRQQLLVLEQLSKEYKPEPSTEARNLYYRVLALLIERVGKVRAAAGYLYREHKKVLQEFTSAHERTRRRKSKQAAKKKS